MTFSDKIEELQDQPEAYRRKVLKVSIVVVMGFIITMWIIDFRNFGESKKDQTKEEAYSPFAMIGGVIEDVSKVLK